MDAREKSESTRSRQRPAVSPGAPGELIWLNGRRSRGISPCDPAGCWRGISQEALRGWGWEAGTQPSAPGHSTWLGCAAPEEGSVGRNPPQAPHSSAGIPQIPQDAARAALKPQLSSEHPSPSLPGTRRALGVLHLPGPRDKQKPLISPCVGPLRGKQWVVFIWTAERPVPPACWVVRAVQDENIGRLFESRAGCVNTGLASADAGWRLCGAGLLLASPGQAGPPGPTPYRHRQRELGMAVAVL